MFDKTINLTSTDGQVSLQVVAGSEGVKSLTLISPPFPPQQVTAQKLMDITAVAIREWFANAVPPAPAAPPASAT